MAFSALRPALGQYVPSRELCDDDGNHPHSERPSFRSLTAHVGKREGGDSEKKEAMETTRSVRFVPATVREKNTSEERRPIAYLCHHGAPIQGSLPSHLSCLLSNVAIRVHWDGQPESPTRSHEPRHGARNPFAEESEAMHAVYNTIRTELRAASHGGVQNGFYVSLYALPCFHVAPPRMSTNGTRDATTAAVRSKTSGATDLTDEEWTHFVHLWVEALVHLLRELTAGDTETDDCFSTGDSVVYIDLFSGHPTWRGYTLRMDLQRVRSCGTAIPQRATSPIPSRSVVGDVDVDMDAGEVAAVFCFPSSATHLVRRLRDAGLLPCNEDAEVADTTATMQTANMPPSKKKKKRSRCGGDDTTPSCGLSPPVAGSMPPPHEEAERDSDAGEGQGEEHTRERRRVRVTVHEYEAEGVRYAKLHLYDAVGCHSLLQVLLDLPYLPYEHGRRIASYLPCIHSLRPVPGCLYVPVHVTIPRFLSSGTHRAPVSYLEPFLDIPSRLRVSAAVLRDARDADESGDLISYDSLLSATRRKEKKPSVGGLSGLGGTAGVVAFGTTRLVCLPPEVLWNILLRVHKRLLLLAELRQHPVYPYGCPTMRISLSLSYPSLSFIASASAPTMLTRVLVCSPPTRLSASSLPSSSCEGEVLSRITLYVEPTDEQAIELTYTQNPSTTQ